ncbi:MAG: aldehyde dehydrogenase family protein [Gammaproteobacteria bacterium]
MSKLVSINPATEDIIFETAIWPDSQLMRVIDSVTCATTDWRNTHLNDRIKAIQAAGALLNERRTELACLITAEMGKVISESYAEIDQCISTCEYYAQHAPRFLADEQIETDASRSCVSYQPLGTVLGIMRWNFPFWQTFRFAVPTLLAGDTVLLKHASNVSQCALAAEQLLHDAGIPHSVFRSLIIQPQQLEPLFKDPRIGGIALTGNQKTGRVVAQKAGANLKKIALEMDASDAFVILQDAPVESAVHSAIASALSTSGQDCRNAKRFIVVKEAAEDFVSLLYDIVKTIEPGDPMNSQTRVGPLARKDLQKKLHQQLRNTIRMGADPIAGCFAGSGEGYYYHPSILDNVRKGMPAYEEIMPGPVFSIIYAKDERDAIRIANDTTYAMGASIWTRNKRRGEQVACQIQSGVVYVNEIVRSDIRLPLGGTKSSGIGRQGYRHGMLEFTNPKTLWIS